MAEEIYKVDDISFTYGSSFALKDISFSVSNGETVAVLGANGSGKSTLLKILNGLIFPSSGSIMFCGKTLTEYGLKGDFLRFFRERVGFLFPEPDVQLFCPTVYDELAFGPLQLDLPMDDVKKRAESLIEMLGLSVLKGRPPYTLSSGEKKKVAIAAVLSVNPDILLLDEPTNGLDPRTQVWLFELLQELKGLKKTFIIATHDLSLAEDIAERAIVIDESHRVVADGPVSSILEDKALLLRTNIIHEHTHRHGNIVHRHSHGPYATHDDHE